MDRQRRPKFSGNRRRRGPKKRRTKKKVDRSQQSRAADSDPSGALDELFIECRERAADAAHFGHDHSHIYLCGAVRIVIFWRGGLRRALARSLKADRPSDEPPNSARFLNSTSAVALQNTNTAHGNCSMRERQYDCYGKHRRYHSNQRCRS
jgi:hypothetical protein